MPISIPISAEDYDFVRGDVVTGHGAFRAVEGRRGVVARPKDSKETHNDNQESEF